MISIIIVQYFCDQSSYFGRIVLPPRFVGDAGRGDETMICSVTKLCDDCTIYNLSFLLPSHVSSYYFCWHTAAVVAFVAVAAVVSSAVSDIDRYRLSTTRYIIRFVFLSETNKSRLGRARKSFGMARPPTLVTGR